MSVRDKVLQAATRCAVEEHAIPSLDDIARRAGVSKGGLLHHFPDRASVLAALMQQAVDETRAALRQAAEDGEQIRVWLELSMPDKEALAVPLAVLAAGVTDLPADVRGFGSWCESVLAEATGDATTARVLRLVGDGLFNDALIGAPPSRADVDDLVAWFEERR